MVEGAAFTASELSYPEGESVNDFIPPECGSIAMSPLIGQCFFPAIAQCVFCHWLALSLATVHCASRHRAVLFLQLLCTMFSAIRQYVSCHRVAVFLFLLPSGSRAVPFPAIVQRVFCHWEVRFSCHRQCFSLGIVHCVACHRTVLSFCIGQPWSQLLGPRRALQCMVVALTSQMPAFTILSQRILLYATLRVCITHLIKYA
jgi:hypothetical protein